MLMKARKSLREKKDGIVCGRTRMAPRGRDLHAADGFNENTGVKADTFAFRLRDCIFRISDEIVEHE